MKGKWVACEMMGMGGWFYIMVKKTCRKRLTAFSRTARRYNHDSPVILERDGDGDKEILLLEWKDSGVSECSAERER